MREKLEKYLAINETDIIKFCATVLITISHLDAFLPNPRWASGGAIGNALFFFISGYGLAKAYLFSGGERGFFCYIRKRYMRIYPAVWVAVLVTFLLSNSESNLEVFKFFFWPTGYWFISAILVFYVPFYWIRQGRILVYQIVAFFVFVLYLFNYIYLDLSIFSVENGYFKWIYYFGLMVFGAFLAGLSKECDKWFGHFCLLVLYLLLYIFLKLKLFNLGFGEFQFLFQLLAFPICYELYLLSKWTGLMELFSRFRFVTIAVAFIAGLTLEIYLVQVPLIHWLEKRDFGYEFPIPLIFSVLPIVPLAFVLKKVSLVVSKFFSFKSA